MTGWIVAGLIALALVLLASVVALLLGRTRPLARALRRLGQRAEQARRLQASLERLSERMLALQEAMQRVADRGARLRRPDRG